MGLLPPILMKLKATDQTLQKANKNNMEYMNVIIKFLKLYQITMALPSLYHGTSKVLFNGFD